MAGLAGKENAPSHKVSGRRAHAPKSVGGAPPSQAGSSLEPRGREAGRRRTHAGGVGQKGAYVTTLAPLRAGDV